MTRSNISPDSNSRRTNDARHRRHGATLRRRIRRPYGEMMLSFRRSFFTTTTTTTLLLTVYSTASDFDTSSPSSSSSLFYDTIEPSSAQSTSLSSSSSSTPHGDGEIFPPTAASITVIVVATFANAFALGSGIFFYAYRKNRIVAAGQPPFLYMVVFGAMLIASSVYFTANDESSGRTIDALNRSCIASTWFTYMGIVIIYMALFSKLWRVEKVTQFRRKQQIMIRHVILPMALMCLGLFGLLLAYTIVDPPQWTRQDLSDDPLGKQQQDRSLGLCSTSPAYAIPMILLVLISIILTLVMSCRVRDKRIPEDLSDARRVTQTLTAHFIIWMIGLALVIVADAIKSSLLFYITAVSVAVLSSFLAVGFLSIPKICYVHYARMTGQIPEGLRHGGNVRVSGLTLNESGQQMETQHPNFPLWIISQQVADKAFQTTTEIEDRKGCIEVSSDLDNNISSNHGSIAFVGSSQPTNSQNLADVTIDDDSERMHSRPECDHDLAIGGKDEVL